MEDADCGHIPGIIAHEDRCAHGGRQGEIAGPQALEMHAIWAHLAPCGPGQQQQIELFETLGEPGEKTPAFPSGLRRLTRLTVKVSMIVVQHKPLKLGFTGRHRSARMSRGQTRRRVPRQTTEEPLVDGTKEAFDFATSPWHTGFGEHQCHLELGTDLLQMV